MTSLILDGQAYDSSTHYADLSWLIHQPPRGSSDPATITALVCDNPSGELLVWLAQHIGAVVPVTVTTRGATLTGSVTITGATTWRVDPDHPLVSAPAQDGA